MCKHKNKEVHWVNGFHAQGYDTRIEICLDCRKNLSFNEIYIPNEYSVDKELFMSRVADAKIAARDQEYDLSYVFEQIYAYISSDVAKIKYARCGFLDFSVDFSPSVIKYIEDADSVGLGEYTKPIVEKITAFVNSIGGWEARNIIVYKQYVSLELK